MQMTNSRAEVAEPVERPDPHKLAFGTVFTPHFFVSEYRAGQWQPGRVEPLRNFSLHPATLVLHYAQTIFEGLKAFPLADGGVGLFRPEMNARRFNASAARMGMPAVEEAVFVDAIEALVREDSAYVPRYPGSMYVRPVMFASEPFIGVKSASEFIFSILTLPCGAYFPNVPMGAGTVDVYVAQSMVRAFPGGTGDVKTAANYAVTLQVTTQAKALGCAQVLFLDSSPERRVEEMGGMNVMFVENGELVTPPLNGTILPGITRNSILDIAKDLGIRVRSYAYGLNEMKEGLLSGRINEAFACGTAAAITGIRSFRMEDGASVAVKSPDPGPVTSQLFETLQGIQYGTLPDSHGWLVRVAGVTMD